MRMTVKDIRDMFGEFDDDDEVSFCIDEGICEELKDSYRYKPGLGYPYKAQDGSLVCDIYCAYSR